MAIRPPQESTIDFPSSGDIFPICEEEKGHYFVRYRVGSDTCKGWVKGKTAEGDDRRYLFEATWTNNVVNPIVSTADPTNPNTFSDRAKSWREPIREISGMHKGYRKDLKSFAGRVSDHIRNKTFLEQDWLSKKFGDGKIVRTSASRVKISRAFVGEEYRVERDYDIEFSLCDKWLITKRYHHRGFYISAQRMPSNTSVDQAREYIEQRYFAPRPR